MSNLFVWIGYTEPFQLFSISHIIALSVLLTFYVGFIMLQKVRPLAASASLQLFNYFGQLYARNEEQVSIRCSIVCGAWLQAGEGVT